MKNILVALDLDSEVRPLIERSLQFGKAFNAKIWLLHIVAPNPDFVGYEPDPQPTRDSRAEELRKNHAFLQQCAKELKEKGIDAEALFVQGPTVATLIEKSEGLAIDMLITGHNEHNLLYKTFVGSVAEGVVGKSKIPILLVPLD